MNTSWFNLGFDAMKRKSWDEARVHFSRLPRTDLEGRECLARCLAQGSPRRLQEAVTELREIVRASPGRFSSHYYLALYLDEIGNHREAEREYTSTISTPGCSAALAEKAILHRGLLRVVLEVRRFLMPYFFFSTSL